MQTETEQLKEALDHAKAIVQLNIPAMPIWSLDLQRLIGQIQFQIWLREKNVDSIK